MTIDPTALTAVTGTPEEESDAAFQAAMAPTVETLRTLTDAIKGAATRNGNLPAVTSVAMADLAAQESWIQINDWEAPIADAQTLGSVTLLAANDAVHSYAVLFSSSRAPLFAHLTLARSCLEACVVSAWLSDPKIDPIERKRRALAELIYSAREARRLEIESRAVADQRVALWEGVADALGWEVGGAPKPTVDGVGRPSMPLGIDGLLVENATARLGRAQWSYLSGVNHVVWFALRQAFLGEPTLNTAGLSVAAIGTESRSVYAQTLCLVRALRTAATIRMTYMGWVDDTWQEAAAVAHSHEVELFRRITATTS